MQRVILLSLPLKLIVTDYQAILRLIKINVLTYTGNLFLPVRKVLGSTEGKSVQIITQCLNDIEQVLQDHQLWQETSPEQEAFLSEQPFFLDTMGPCQWLQWVLIPRLKRLVSAGEMLPERLAITAYYEQVLSPEEPVYTPLLIKLNHLDRLFSQESA